MKQITASFPMTASADLESRTITGLAVPYGVEGYTSWGRTVVQAGAIEVGDRVHMLVSHDADRPIGKMIDAQDGLTGLTARFKIAATAAGDDALLEAAEGIRDGLSVGMSVDEYAYDEETEVTTILRGSLREVSLVTFPAFESARVEKVAASEPEPEAPQTPDAAPAVADNPQEETVDESTAVVEAAAPASLPRARVQDPFPYRETVRDERGVQASFFRDMLHAGQDSEAAARFNVAQTMMTAAGTMSDIAEIIPTTYRPDMYVPQLTSIRPVIDAFSRQVIDGPNPQRIPKFKAASGLMADHVENTNPVTGAFETEELVITPKAVSGVYEGSREMFEGATPAVDALIMNAIREEYAGESEAYAATTFLAGATAGAVVDISDGVTMQVVQRMITFQANRKRAADVFLAGTTLFPELVKQVDSAGRPLNPYVGATNAAGSTGDRILSVNVGGYSTPYVPSLVDGLLGVSSDAVTFESGLRMWRWEEKSGPATIEIAAFGYIACAVLRAAGLLKFATQA